MAADRALAQAALELNVAADEPRLVVPVELARVAGDPDAAGHRRAAGGDLGDAAAARDRDRDRPRRLADPLRVDPRADRRGRGARHRHRHPRPQPGGDRGAPARAPDPDDRGLVARRGGRSAEVRRGRGGGRAGDGGARLRTTRTSTCSPSCAPTPPLVTVGQFLVVADTFVEDIPPQEHRRRAWGPGDNPATALRAWLDETEGFEPDPFVNAKLLLTASPGRLPAPRALNGSTRHHSTVVAQARSRGRSAA